MTGDAFRDLALALDGAIEASHMGHPDFRANGRIFATLRADERTGMVKLTPEQQAEFLRDHPAMFAPSPGAWGRQGCTDVVLKAAEDASGASGDAAGLSGGDGQTEGQSEARQEALRRRRRSRCGSSSRPNDLLQRPEARRRSRACSAANRLRPGRRRRGFRCAPSPAPLP